MHNSRCSFTSYHRDETQREGKRRSLELIRAYYSIARDIVRLPSTDHYIIAACTEVIAVAFEYRTYTINVKQAVRVPEYVTAAYSMTSPTRP